MLEVMGLKNHRYPPFRLDAGGHDPGITLTFTGPVGPSG
jgi:hypothetical protein